MRLSTSSLQKHVFLMPTLEAVLGMPCKYQPNILKIRVHIGNGNVEYVHVEYIRRRIYVDSTLRNGHQVERYFSTSIPRRFNVEIFRAIGRVDFSCPTDVDSTSRSICANMVYFSTQIQRQLDVEISLSIRPIDSSMSNIRRFHVDVSSKVLFSAHHQAAPFVR